MSGIKALLHRFWNATLDIGNEYLQTNLFKCYEVKIAMEAKAWFSYVGKIPDDRKFYCSPTVPDFAD